jgi:hypothetical protein
MARRRSSTTTTAPLRRSGRHSLSPIPTSPPGTRGVPAHIVENNQPNPTASAASSHSTPRRTKKNTSALTPLRTSARLLEKHQLNSTDEVEPPVADASGSNASTGTENSDYRDGNTTTLYTGGPTHKDACTMTPPSVKPTRSLVGGVPAHIVENNQPSPTASAASSDSSSRSYRHGGSSPPSSSSSKIKVVVRVRPMSDYETRQGILPVTMASTQDATVSVISGKERKQMKSTYTFDNVFTTFSTQEEVFKATVEPAIAYVMTGFESVVFTYGQTGTGKTYTSKLTCMRSFTHHCHCNVTVSYETILFAVLITYPSLF